MNLTKIQNILKIRTVSYKTTKKVIPISRSIIARMATELTIAFRIFINEPHQVICCSQVQIAEIVFHLHFNEPGKMQLKI